MKFSDGASCHGGDPFRGYVDIDSDDDGISDSEESHVDTDGDGVEDYLDIDSDNDGIYDVVEGGDGALDTNGDGIIDNNDVGYSDTNNNGMDDDSENTVPPHSDSDNIPDFLDPDSDGDGCNDVLEAGFSDSNNDGYLGNSSVSVNAAGKVNNTSDGYTTPNNINGNAIYDFQEIGPNNSGTDTRTECDSYTWINGITYTSNNNSATHTVTNSVGCDSVVTLNLTIIFSTTGTDQQTACDTYTWIDGITYTANNNSATHTLTNSAGCDSVATLDLTINNSSTGIDPQISCISYTWIDGITYTASNNTATHTLTNSLGCDSVVTLNLTINSNNTGTDIQTACDSYTWIDGITYTANNNSATHTLTNSFGCDSVVTLNLTINSNNTGIDLQTACDSYTWIDGNTYIVNNNTATHTLTNTAGCDSVVTLDLTISAPDDFDEITKLLASDGAVDDKFGLSVSISGNRAIVGSSLDDSIGSNSGAAYIYELNNGSWMQTQILIASDAAAGDEFGYAVSISGDRVIAGSYKDDNGSGSAYIYFRQ